MKLKVTRKQLKENYRNIVILNGDAEHLADMAGLKSCPMWYNCGVYGWNWDGLEMKVDGIGFVAVVWGYRSFPAGLDIFHVPAGAFDVIKAAGGGSDICRRYLSRTIREAVQEARG